MGSFFDDVKTFHETFNLRIGEKCEFPDLQDQHLRWRLINEELKELRLAHQAGDMVECADAIADLIYVVCGMAVSYGIPLNHVWEEVQRSNMAKAGANGPKYRSDGKVLKPEGWTPPDIAGVLEGYGG